MGMHTLLGAPNDFGLMVDFRKTRAIVRANTALIEGISLEEIPPGMSGYNTGMVLIHRDWKRLYFVIERESWTEDDYFRYAEKRMKERHITKP